MRVWLTKAVPGVGQPNTIVEVQPGYARNFLFPRQLAVVVTPALEAQHQAKQDKAKRAASKQSADHQARLAALKGRSLVLVAKANGERLFGSVTPSHIHERIKEVFGVDIPASAIEVGTPIKTLGNHTVTVRLGSQSTSLTMEVRADG